MSDWNAADLSQLGATEELSITSARPDGTLRPFVTIWVVRAGDDIYVRSYKGHDGGWYNHAERARIGRIRGGGVERDVRFEDAPADLQEEVDAAYRAKYGHYSRSLVDQMVSPSATAATFRVTPR